MEQIKQFKGNAEMLYYKDSKIRESIDKLLEKNAQLEATLGMNETVKSLSKVKVKQDRIFQKIKLLDEEFYHLINPYPDDEPDI